MLIFLIMLLSSWILCYLCQAEPVCTDITEGLVKMKILIQESWWSFRFPVFNTLSVDTDAARFWTTFYSKVESHDQQCWHFGPDNSLFYRVVLCIIGHLVISLPQFLTHNRNQVNLCSFLFYIFCLDLVVVKKFGPKVTSGMIISSKTKSQQTTTHRPNLSYHLILQIKLYWNASTTISLSIFFGYFCTKTAVLSNSSKTWGAYKNLKYLLHDP